VPWCPSCDRFLSPPTVTREGNCPKCGRPVEPGRARPPEPVPTPSAGEEELPPVPRHLKILGAAMVVYLGYRFLQGVEWVVHRFS
jgi:hypothetical protein